MASSFALFQCIATTGFSGEGVVETLPELARKVWEGWGKQRTAEQRQAELAAIAQALPAEVQQASQEAAHRVSPELHEDAVNYLNQVPASLRQAFRRSSDPSGSTVPGAWSFGRPEELLPLLPTRLPRGLRQASTACDSPTKGELTPHEYVRTLESELSRLIDAKDVPGWKVNPAFDPAVIHFIQRHAHNAAFVRKAQSMQQNRASYFAAARAQESNPQRPKRVNSPQRDHFGHLSNAPPGQINAVLTGEPQTAEEIAKKCNLTVERVLQHFDTWFGTDRPLGRCLRKREGDKGSSPRSAEEYWLEDVTETTKRGR